MVSLFILNKHTKTQLVSYEIYYVFPRKYNIVYRCIKYIKIKQRIVMNPLMLIENIKFKDILVTYVCCVVFW